MLTIVVASAIIIVVSGGNPNFRNTYEIGRFNKRMPPTTNWYCLIFPVAKADVINEFEREFISAVIITKRVNTITYSGISFSHRVSKNFVSSRIGIDKIRRRKKENFEL
jgi:hypothetical protein